MLHGTLDLSTLRWLVSETVDPSALAGLTIALALGWLLLAPSRARRAVASLPRPRGALPVVGSTLQLMLEHREDMPSWLLDEVLHYNGKPFVLDILTRKPIVVLSSVEAMEDVYKTHADKFAKGDNLVQALGNLFGDGLFVSDGAKWHHQRKTASLLFTPQMMRDVMDDVMVHHTERLCAVVADVAHKRGELDIKHLLELFATDVFASVGFGVDLQFMTSDNRDFFDHFGRANDNTFYRQLQPTFLWKLKRLLRVGAEREHVEDVAWLDRFVYQIIEDSIARKRKDPAAQRRDIISLCVDGFTSASGEIDLKEIRDMAMVTMSAGRDTTAFAMSWFLIMMAQNPRVQRKIRDELRSKVPELMTGHVQAPRKDQTNDLVYLEAAVMENLRLNTVVPTNTREAVEDVTLSDGTFLAAGTQVFLATYSMSRLPWVWGEDAREFKPERWIDPATGKLLAVSPFKFLTFSAGRRICPGKRFSIMEMKIALAALLSKFEIETVRDPHAFQYELNLSLGIRGPVLVRPKLVKTRREDTRLHVEASA